MITLRLVPLFVVGLSTCLAAAPLPPPSSNAPIKFVRSEPPIFPRAAEVLGLRDGEARVAILIDDTGRMRDYLAVGYSHRSFADAAILALKAWHFEPARVHGLPRGAVAVLRFTFETAGTMVNINLIGDDIAESFFRRIQADSAGFSACMPHDLDQIPLPT